MKLNKLSDLDLSEIESILLITDRDLDGLVGGSIIKQKFPTAIWYANRKKSQVEELIESGEIYNYSHMFMVDYSPATIKELRLLNEIFNNRLYIFDHHQSFVDMISGTEFENSFNVDLNYCGAMITAQVFGYENNPIVKLTNIYDLWKDDSSNFSEAELLNSKLDFLGNDLFKSRMIELLNGNREDLLDKEEYKNFLYKLRKDADYIDRKVKEAYIVGEEAIVFAENWKSEICNRILKKNIDVKIAMVIDISKNSISIRSKNGTALEKASEIGYNFGGHKNASGVQGDFKSIFYNLIFKIKESEWTKY